VIWDNRMTLHHAAYDDFDAMYSGLGLRRVMLRSILVGARPVWHSKEQTVEHHF